MRQSRQRALLGVSLCESNQVAILDLDEPEREACTICVSGKQPYGLAFDDARPCVYVTCWGDAKLTAIDLSSISLEPEKSLPAARLPAWATRRQGTSELWISNEGAGIVTIFDIAEWKITDEIATGGGPSDIAFTDGGRQAWVTNERDATLSLIDAVTRRKVHDIRVGEVPQGIAILSGGKRLLVANFGSNSISVVDTDTTEEVKQISVGLGPVDVVTLGSGSLEQAWVSCFAGGLVSVISIERQQQIQQVETGGKPHGLETHPNGEHIYVAVRELNQLAVLTHGTPSTVLRRISMPGGPARMAVAPSTDAYTDIPFRSDGAFGHHSRSTARVE
jgi:YVTN family beta-propeller protein